MRAAMAVCEAVMASMRDALRPGITELGAELLSSHPFEGGLALRAAVPQLIGPFDRRTIPQ